MADNQQYGPLAQKPETAKDIRRVVANATRTKGKGLTIANKDELNNRKQEEQIANNVNKGVSKGTAAPVSSSTPKVTLQPTQPQPIGPVKPNTDLFKNPQLGPINNIQVIKQDNQAQNIQNNNNGQDNFINTHGRATELKTPIDIDNALMDLYSDIKEKINRNELNNVNVQGLKQAYSEFTNMDDEVVTSLVSDIASMINKKLPFSVDNMKKLKSLYPELASAAWGFDVGGGQNMYQGGGLKETLSSGSPTDLNKRGPVGIAAETVLNPLGQATTVLDSASQSIGQVDSNTDKILGWDIKSTPELKQALSKVVSDEKLLNKYYEEYQNYVKEHGVLSNLYTDFYEGDTLVEKLWNVARGKKKVNVDAGFKSWLVDKVNNQVNGWQGEFWGAANQLNDVQGPNVAKMYSNVPASTVKTATAITRAITNPVDTVSGLVHLIGTEEGHQALAARYGSWEAFANAIEQDPVGTSSDALAVVEGGASATRAVATLGTKGALSASIATEMLGAARTSESLFKIASRLEKLSSKAGAIEKIAGTSSNLGVDIPLKGGMVQIGKETKVINGIIKGLREWGESGDSMIKKVAKYSADRSEQGIGKIAKDTKDFLKEGPVNSLANKLMGTASDTDKLFKAANPNINTLRNTTDYKNKRANMDLATKTIVEAGYTPKTISEWAKSHAATLNKKWNEFKQLIKDKSDVEVDSSEVLHEIKDFIKREKEGATVNQRGDIRALELEVQDLERRGKLSMDVIENKKEHYNSSWKDSEKMKKGDIYEKGVKILGNSMRKVQDNILGKGPESTKALRQQIKALMDTKEDIYKADVRNQKKKSDIAGGGVIESYGRLAGVGDILKGGLQLLGNPGEGLANIGKGAGKVVFGKAMGKARDVDYLTKKGFEGLSKKNKKPSSEGLREKMQERRELSELRDKRKELDKKYKEGKISDDEYLKQSEEVEYGIAQKRARLSVIGDKEMKMDSKTRAKMVELVKKRAKDVGFATEVMDGMEKDTQGYTDLQKKLIALEKNPGDTTAQHELFHAFFSVVDNKTKTYILDEAKKILKEKGLSDINAEEWLAESFGIYAKRQQIKLGLIDAPKGFKAKLRDFFQRVYEFMQRFNGDRGTINKLFDEILGDRKMKNGIMDLSDLLGNKTVKERTLYGGRGEGLRNKSVYHGSHADFDKFDSSHMGEGEGAQAHGWGHYVAVEERTGRHYADMKNPSNYEYKGRGLKDIEKELLDSKPGEKVELIPIKQMLDSGWMSRYQGGERFDEIKKEGLERAKREMESTKEIYEENPEGKLSSGMTYKERYEIDKRLYDAWKNLDKKDFDFEKPSRNLYNLEIPDPIKKDTPTGSNYLEEDGKITKEQMNKIYNEVVKEFEKKKEGKAKRVQNLQDGQLRVFKNLIEQAPGMLSDGKGLYTTLSNVLGGQKQASKFLESLGYDGIHYFGGRDGEAYVIFNDDALKIKEHIRYKKKTDSEGRELSDRQLKYFGNSKVRNDKGELVPVYHFTADDFNTVDFKKGAQNYFWFTSDKNASDRAMGVRPGMQKKRKDMYVDIKNPAGWTEYNKFGTDELKARGYDGVILKEKDGSFEGFIWDKENQVKYVDNQNPTRASKDMRFKKDLSLKAKDAEYEKAVKEGDTENALGMLRKAAAEKGYNSPEDYKGAGTRHAPSADLDRVDFRNLDKLRGSVENGGDTNVYGLANGVSSQPDDYFSPNGRRWYGYDDKAGMEAYYAISDAMNSIKRQMENYGKVKSMPKITVYRAVPSKEKSIKGIKEVLDSYNNRGMWGNEEPYYTFKNTKSERYKKAKEFVDWDSGKYDSLEAYDKDIKKWLEDELYDLEHEPNQVKEGMLESGGEWVTPSREYAKQHGGNRFNGDYRIITEKVPADELWWDGNDIREWGFDDGNNYVVKKGVKNSRKNLEITYDDEGKLIPLEKRFNEKKPDVRYKKKTEEDNRMVALHNTSLEKLVKSKELGGLVAPSVALTKKGIPFENYGEISFIGNKKLVNPSKDVQVGETDLYSPRVPQPTLEWKEGVTRAQQEKIAEKFGMRMGELHDYIDGYSQNYYERTYPGLDKAVAPFIKKSLFKGFTEMGDRIYKPYDMKHILQEMFSEGTEGAESGIFQGTFNEAMARLSNDANSLEDVRDKIGNKAGLEEKYKVLSDKYTDKAWDLLGGDNGMAIFSENIKKSVPEITRELNKYDIDVTEKQVQQLKNLVEKGLKLPKSYVEAKIKRGVGFDEFSAVVVPENKVAEVKKIVGDKIDIVGYKPGERMKVIDEVADSKGLRFKKKVDQTQTPEFKKWFEGSKVVDKEGKPLVAYHGTHGDFTIFDKEKIGSNTNNEGLFGKGFYFTTDSKYGDYYKGKGWSKDRLEGKTMQVYLDIKNPFMWNDYKGPQAIEKLRKELGLPKSVLEWNNYGDNGIHVFTKPEQSRRFTEALEKAGYDGVWFKYDNGTQDEIVAFEPNQIKSATDNIGTFDKNNPDIRYKKGVEKKADGLEKKKTSTASAFQGRVDSLASRLGVKGGNTVQKMKRINKIIKEDKYKGTDVKKKFYQLKWEYKKQYIINNNKKIKDKGFKKTTIRVWQNGKKADWHFTKKQYDELKELGYIE